MAAVHDAQRAEENAERLLRDAEVTAEKFMAEPAAVNEDLRMLADLKTSQAGAWATLALACRTKEQTDILEGELHELAGNS